jgi:hypothetical protein
MLMAILIVHIAAALRTGVRQFVCAKCCVGLLLTNAHRTALAHALVSLQGYTAYNSTNGTNSSSNHNDKNNNSTTIDDDIRAEFEKELIAELLKCFLCLAGSALGFGYLGFVGFAQPAIKNVSYRHPIVNTQNFHVTNMWH